MRCPKCDADNDPMAALCAECGAALGLPPVEEQPETGEQSRQLEAERTAVLPPIARDEPTEPPQEPKEAQAVVPVREARPGASAVLAGVIAAVVVIAIGLPGIYLFLNFQRSRQQVAANEPVIASATLDAAAIASLSRQAYLREVAGLWPQAMAALQAYSEAVATEDLDEVANVSGDQRIEMDRLYLRARELHPPPDLEEVDRRLLNALERGVDILNRAAIIASDPTNEAEALRQAELLYGDSERAQKDFQYVAQHAEGLQLTVDARPFEASDRLAHLAEQVRIQAEEALSAPGRPTEGGFESYDDITPEPSPSGLPEEELLPQSQHRQLTEADLEDMTRRELFVARNEIYARHGRIFQNEPLQRYFNRWSWYKPRPDYDEADLSEVERRNADFIRQHETSR